MSMAHEKHPSDGVSCCFWALETTLTSEGLDHGRDQQIGPTKGVPGIMSDRIGRVASNPGETPDSQRSCWGDCADKRRAWRHG